MTSWHINVVRVPLNEDCWLGVNTPKVTSGKTYQAAIVKEVERLNDAGLFVILDLHFAAPGTEVADKFLPMADATHSIAFWSSVARTFRQDGMVIFDLYNEPVDISWSCWRSGCVVRPAGSPSYQSVGMVQLLAAVRDAGANQPVMISGDDVAEDLSQWLRFEPKDQDHALLASIHSYGDPGQSSSGCFSSCEVTLEKISQKVPVIFGELGETDCGSTYIDALMNFADKYGISYLAWTWNPTDLGWSCSKGPSLITSYSGAPTAYGEGFRDHLAQLYEEGQLPESRQQ